MTFVVSDNNPTELPESVGPYKILENLGRGGMGEVFLAIDPVCERRVALKRIRPELQSNKTIQRRFLREARVASSLAHPSIVPILEIHMDAGIEKGSEIFYTMPYIEGPTLRQILRLTREQEKNAGTPHPIGSSISSLSRIFLQICEAVAYTHSKGILHRDLKPENIIVGKYGEVMILDWGIADFINSLESDDSLPEARNETKKAVKGLTMPGKITGTLAYMAPERIKGKSSSVQTDLYALGVMLYQLLSLQLPFHRKTIAAFKKQVDSEEIVDPIEIAPYRDIPHPLAAICLKCLMKNPKERFQSVLELIAEIKRSIEGHPEWILAKELDLEKSEDWLFQENVLLAKDLAILRNFDVTEWAAISISKMSFADNFRIDARVKISGNGIGFLLSARTPEQLINLEEGYLVWIGLETCQLFRSNVQVIESAKLPLDPKQWHTIRIEKVDDQLKLTVDKKVKLSITSHLPLPGKHIGILSKDEDFEIDSCKIYDGSHNVMVGCLAVPNAFLSHELFDLALEEYRRVGQCFPGRMEGREALFRAGMTLLQKAKLTRDDKTYHLALKEFENLYRTPGAPLEYLGKSMVYEAMGDIEEEAKSLEIALRKFPKHPLLSVVKEHIVYRMHESSLNNREAAYRIILLSIRHSPDILDHPHSKSLIERLRENWEQLPFIEGPTTTLTEIAIQLAFWLAKVPIIVEIGKQLASKKEQEVLFCNALYCLLELEAVDDVKTLLELAPDLSVDRRRNIEAALNQEIIDQPEARALFYVLKHELKKAKPPSIIETLKKTKQSGIDFQALALWNLMLEKKWDKATALVKKIKPDGIKENSPLHFPYGCYLYAQDGSKKAIAHFSAVLDTPYPTSTALPSQFVTGRIDDKKGWIERAFWWEKKELHRQIDLFYKVIGKPGKVKKS
jgi:serine/threonine protein kinase/tetratricopeptide (TPR) repeat protein